MPLRRVLTVLVFVDAYLATMLISGCEKPATKNTPAVVAEKSAEPGEVKAEKPATPTHAAAAEEQAAEGKECGEGQDCAGNCNQWDDAAAEVAKRDIPNEAKWETFKVEGMHCGGCERRVIANLGSLDGVASVEADAELGQVRVAAVGDAKVRDIAQKKIESLGYRVVQ